jgi:hypothetical protein
MNMANDDSPTTNWPSSEAYWVVTKCSAGQAVGFGEVVPGTSSGLVSASGLKGRIDAGTVASGYVGEVIEATGTTATTSLTELCNVTLTPGNWLVYSTAVGNMSSSAAGDYVDFILSLTSASSTPALTVGGQSFGVSRGFFTTGGASRGVGTVVASVKISVTDVYYLNSTFSGTGTIIGHLTAVRIA